jgi:probable F420-dependent oxidoreductase, MSMEG_4141 family
VSLGRIGVWLGTIGALPAAEERSAVRELEAVGYGTIWFGETPFSKEALSHAALILDATERVTVATGIASIWLRSPSSAASGAATLAEAHPGRFVLGLGVSHAPIVASIGHDYTKPLTRMREYLDAMDASSYTGPLPADPAPRVLAALAPKMLELARDRTQGAHPYLVTPEHTVRARAILGVGPLLAPEQAFVLESDPVRARTVAREHLKVYLTLPNYAENWRRSGFDEADLADGGSDRLVDALVAWGDESAVRERVEEHFAAGADHVALQALGEDPVGQLTRLAPALG